MDSNVIEVDNYKYIVTRMDDKTIQAFNIRVNYILKRKPTDKNMLDKLYNESLVEYNKNTLKCDYD